MKKLKIFIVVFWPTFTQAVTIYNLGLAADSSILLPRSISDSGTVVVGYTGRNSANPLLPRVSPQAFRWSPTQEVQALGLLPGMTASMATSVSADGSKIIGTSSYRDLENPRGASRAEAFIWTAYAGIQQLLPSETQSQFSAVAISSNGETVLGSRGNTGFVYNSTVGLLDFGVTRGEGYVTPVGVNSSGTIVFGNEEFYDEENDLVGAGPFRWTQSGGTQNLGVPNGYDYFSVSASSASGAAMVGKSGGVDLPFEEGFRWTSNGGWEVLGSLSPGDSSTYPTAINFDGSVVVGSSTEAFIWTESGGMQALDDYLTALGGDLTGWSLGTADAISPDGSAIAGLGRFNGEMRTYVITNVPEPSALSLMAVGLGGLAMLRRRLS